MNRALLIIALLVVWPLAGLTKELPPEITPLEPVDENQLQHHRDIIEEITKMEFGSKLRRDKSDLRYLTRIIAGDYIKPAETLKQLALGVVLGDIFVKELGLEWQNYKDSDGTSRATCLPKTTHCLFPVTMFAKRMRLGAKPTAEQMFEHGSEILEPYLPRLPYSAK